MRRGLGLGLNIGTNMLPNVGAKTGTKAAFNLKKLRSLRGLGLPYVLAFQRGMASSAKLDPVQVSKTIADIMRIHF